MSLKKNTASKKQKGKGKGGTLGKSDWEMIALGTFGGVVSGNISSYILKTTHISDNKWVAFDGGSPIDGLWKWNMRPENKDCQVNLDDIEAFLISHAHLDHISGFAILTPSLMQRKSPKLKFIANSNVMYSCNNFIFNDYLWPSTLWDDKFIQKITVSPRETLEINSNLSVQSLPIQHGSYGKYNTVKEKQEDSTVFIVTDTLSNKTVVYFGDVTSVSHVPFLNSNNSNTGRKLKKQQQIAKKQLDIVWNYLSDFVLSGNLSAIFIECAFSSKCRMLFGHMNAKLLAEEFDRLLGIMATKFPQKLSLLATPASCASNPDLSGITLIITHLKPDILGDTSNVEGIKAEVLNEFDRFRFKRIVFPEQGEKYTF